MITHGLVAAGDTFTGILSDDVQDGDDAGTVVTHGDIMIVPAVNGVSVTGYDASADTVTFTVAAGAEFSSGYQGHRPIQSRRNSSRDWSCGGRCCY